MKLAFVEVEDSKFVRIFKSRAMANASGRAWVMIERGFAVGRIRYHIWLRCRGECEMCEAPVTESSGHMHEKKHRGKGGEISLDNSIFICAKCHQYEHRERAPQWKKNHEHK